MKKYALFSFVFILSLILLGSSAKSASADVWFGGPGCATGAHYSTTTGKACGSWLTVECQGSDLFSSVTGKACGNTTQPPQDNSSVVSQFNNLFKSNFQVGLKGSSDVSALQSFLKDQGYYFGKIDGSYGRISARAVSDFQSDNNIGSIIMPTPQPLPTPCPTGTVATGMTQSMPGSYICSPISTSQSPVISGVDGPQSLNVNQQGTWKVTTVVGTYGNSYSVVWGDEASKLYSSSMMDGGMYTQSATFTHTYAQAGNYTPTFTVTNRDGKTAQTSLSVNVGSTIAPSALSSIPNVLVFSSQSGVNPSSQSITVYGCPKNGCLIGGSSASDGVVSWLSVATSNDSTGTNSGIYTISAHVSDASTSNGTTPLAAGTYNGLIVLTANGQKLTIPVTLFVSGSTTSTSNISATLNQSSSTASQFVAVGTGGANDATKASYNFTSIGGTSTINELKFTFTGTNTVALVRVGNVSAPVVGNVAYLTGLNIVVPNGGSGINVDAFVSYSGVGVNGVPSGSTSSIALTYAKYNSNGIVSTYNPSVSAPTMKIVASKPTVSLNASGATLTNGSVDLGHIVVSADPKGDIILNAIPVHINLTMNGFSFSNNIVVKDVNDNIVPATLVGSSINFTNGYRIPAGSSQTFKFFVLFSNLSGNSTVSLSLGNSNLFSWTDITGNSSTPITTDNGTYLYNYPTNSVSVSGSIITTSLPSQVSNLSALASGSSVNLSWSAVPVQSGMPPIGTYNIYRGTSQTAISDNPGRTSSSLIAQGNVLSYTDSGLSPGTYYYRVAAQDNSGLVGPASNQVFASVVVVPISNTSYDYNNDGKVDYMDLGTLLRVVTNAPGYGSCPSGKVCDINNDGLVNISDLIMFTKNNNLSVGTAQYDYNNDGKVDFSDLSILAMVVNNVQSCPSGKNCDVSGDGVVNILDLKEFIQDNNIYRPGCSSTSGFSSVDGASCAIN